MVIIVNLSETALVVGKHPIIAYYAKISLITFPCTSVNRKSRPAERKVRRSWFRPSRCKIVICRTWTEFSTTVAAEMGQSDLLAI